MMCFVSSPPYSRKLEKQNKITNNNKQEKKAKRESKEMLTGGQGAGPVFTGPPYCAHNDYQKYFPFTARVILLSPLQ
jgi:hypothetical protein